MRSLAGKTEYPRLTDAFESFNEAARRLEATYSGLQEELARLRAELEERNVALASSMRDNEHMRTALERILQALPCGVIAISAHGEVVLANSEARRILDQAGEPTDERSQIIRRLAATIREPLILTEPDEDREIAITTERGRKWLAVRASSVPDAGLVPAERRVGSVKVFMLRDATAHKERENEREQSRNLLALSEVAAILAHEIRNPLGSMELFAELLSHSAALDADARLWVENIVAGIRQLSATVSNVLRLHASGSPVLTPIVLDESIRSAVEFVRPLVAHRGVELRFASERIGLKILADANELRQVILNLVGNAVRYTPAGGHILVTAREAQRGAASRVLVEVADSGQGIALEIVPYIFEAGFTTTGSGPGLGLAVCKRIVQQFGGAISVNSQLGSGTTFSLEFPIYDECN